MSKSVSILIPVYNSEKYISKCLHSVFSQTYANIEYIIVNDAFQDNSIAIIQDVLNEYPQRESHVRLINHEKNQGIAKTRNTLLDHATGDYVYFVDSDDSISTDAVEILMRTAEKNNADIVRCNYREVKGDKIIPMNHEPIGIQESYLEQCLLGKNHMNSIRLLLIRRHIFTDFGLSFETDVNGCEDFLMTVKLFYHTNNITDIPDCLYDYNLENAASITHNHRGFRSNAIAAANKIKLFLKEKGLFETYHQPLRQLMFTSKMHFLINKEIRDIDKYVKTFPESNNCYRQYNFTKKQRLLFFLAEKKAILLLKFICNFI